MAGRWQREANERLRLAKEAGQLERKRAKTQKSILDLSNDLAAACASGEKRISTP